MALMEAEAQTVQTKPAETERFASGFLSEAELLKRLPVCRRTLTSWRRRGQIPFVRLPGSRRVIYHWQSIEAALLRMQQGER